MSREPCRLADFIMTALVCLMVANVVISLVAFIAVGAQ